MTCYTEKETLFLLDCIDFVVENGTEYQEYSIINNDLPLNTLREKVFQQYLNLKGVK